MTKEEAVRRVRSLVLAAGIPDDEARWEFAEYAAELLANQWGFDDAEALAIQAMQGR